MKRTTRIVFVIMALLLARNALAALYVCEVDGKKVYSDRVCGTAAKEVSGEHVGIVNVNNVPDEKTIKEICLLAKAGKAEEHRLLESHRNQFSANYNDNYTPRSDYESKILANREAIKSRLVISESFRCRRPQMVERLESLITWARPFSSLGNLEIPPGAMDKCMNEVRDIIRETGNESSGC
jgi:hypothetical protein